ncbi:hypothetical protein HA402_005958 [Bradysia odoriphaga]|nr:hypothetical protein HA402_005958 [Bradysia odoriphaga]
MQQSERQSQKICFGPSLSYDADLHLPCIANVLKIEVNDQYGRLVTAGCNIDIGDTLLIEQAYIRVSTGNECYNCAEKKCSLIPYVTCTDVMFCSEECSHNDFHSVECNIIFHSDETFGIKSSSFVLRSIMAGINAFKNIDDMMQFIDDCRSTDSKEISTSFATPESRYRSFFKLSSFGNLGDVRDQASSIFHGMVRSKDLAIKFDSPKKRRFLIHLICHHTLIVRTNGFGGLCDPSDSVLKSSVQPTENQFERNIFLAASYLNHSCLPNVAKLSKNNFAVVKAIQPISEGQQLFINYLDDESTERTSEDRNKELENSYGFRCKCDLCIAGVRADARMLEMDNNFLFVVKNIENFKDSIYQIKECCIAFIKNHSDKLASEPGYFILTTLTAMLQKELEL